MRVLITGASGLLGRHVVPLLAAAGHSVFACSRNEHLIESARVAHIRTDLAKHGFVRDFPRQVDCVIHLAQSEHYKDFPARSAEIFAVNLAATQELLDYARSAGVSHFIYASSGGIYESGRFSLAEDAPLLSPNRIDYYLSSKLSSELLTQSYRAEFSHTILRFFFIYGAGQRSSMLLPRLYGSVARGEVIQLQGLNGLIINPIHVSDAAQAVVAATRSSESRTINIAGPEELSLRQICETFGLAIRRSPVFEVGGTESPRLVANTRLMNELLGPARRYLREQLADLRADAP